MEDTIVAVSTASGSGAVGIVRISGPAVLAILNRHCRNIKNDARPRFEDRPRAALHCRFFANESDSLIDEGLIVFFPGPHSYTGEDVAEISLHGNPLILRDAVNAILAANRDTRPARPGEFTRRAYLAGRMDLSRAEAVHRIVTARTELELEAGRKNLYGELSRNMSRFRSAIIHLKAETEAEVDFSTEDLTFESLEQRRLRARDLIAQIDELLRRGRETERLRHGFQVALAGVPNAGKSSLLNRMLGWDRSIVSPVPGTTRDYVSEEIDLDGVMMRFVDTAGLRESDDVIEAQGVRLSHQALQNSQIILHVIDGERERYDLPDLRIAGEHAPEVIHVFNKSDVRDVRDDYAPVLPAKAVTIAVSCKTGAGIEELRQRLRQIVFADDAAAQDPLLLEDRHRYHLSHVREALERVLELWEHRAPDEVVALELDEALFHAGAVTGRIDNEEILGRIFSVFCVGK